MTRVTPVNCSICNDPDGNGFDDEIILCDKCRATHKPMTPVFVSILIQDGHKQFCDMMKAYQERTA